VRKEGYLKKMQILIGIDEKLCGLVKLCPKSLCSLSKILSLENLGIISSKESQCPLEA